MTDWVEVLLPSFLLTPWHGSLHLYSLFLKQGLFLLSSFFFCSVQASVVLWGGFVLVVEYYKRGASTRLEF